jgi:thymidylate kinase
MFILDKEIITSIFKGKAFANDMQIVDRSGLFLASSSQVGEITIDNADFIISEQPLKGQFHWSRTLRYMKNKDNEVRFLFPWKQRRALLNFYSDHNKRNRRIKQLWSALLSVGVMPPSRMGRVYLYSRTEVSEQNIKRETGSEHAAYFLGTKGPDRTPIAMLLDENKESKGFVKFLLKDTDPRIINKERCAQDMVRSWNLEGLNLPETLHVSEGEYAIFSDQRTDRMIRNTEMGSTIESFLKRAKSQTERSIQSSNALFWETLEMRWDNMSDLPSSARLLHRMAVKMLRNFPKERSLLFHFAHGDLTPWNCFQGDQALLFDFEASEIAAPLGYDIMHWFVQSSIFGGGTELRSAKQLAEQKFIQLFPEHQRDFKLYWQLYLLISISRQLPHYSNSDLKAWDRQAQLRFWEEALYAEVGTSHRSMRVDYLLYFGNQIRTFEHAFIKFIAPGLTELPDGSDLDLIVREEDRESLFKMISTGPGVRKIVRHKRSFMDVVEIHFHDAGFLSIDLINDCKRKALRFLNVSDVLLSSSEGGRGVRVPEESMEMAFTFLFYHLNGAEVPYKYVHPWYNWHPEKRAAVLGRVAQYLGLPADEIWKAMAGGADLRSEINSQLKNNISLTERIGLKWNYWLDTFKTYAMNRGWVITLSGVDGAGKTTIISELKGELERKYRRPVVLLRHRPGLLPILSSIKYGEEKAEQRAAVNQPRLGKNGGVLSSILRFSYYLTDYLLGQWFIYFKYTRKGNIVLYDRYYFDFIFDGRRSNIDLPVTWTEWLYKMIFKADVNFFLYAEPEVILSRKKEVPETEIRKLTTNYKRFFTNWKARRYSAYWAIENLEKRKTMQQLLMAISKAA